MTSASVPQVTHGMKKTKRTIIQVLEAHDIRKKRESARIATKYVIIGLVLGVILGMIVRGFM